MVIETAVEGTCVFRLSGPAGHEGIPKVACRPGARAHRRQPQEQKRVLSTERA